MRLFTLFFIINVFFAHSQGDNSYSFKQLSDENGNFPAGALGIVQDSIGYIWMASVNGINKFDGNTIKFFPKNFVSESDIIIYDKKIYTDREQNTWIITGERSIEKLNIKEETFTAVGNLPMPKVLHQDVNLNFYVGTSNNGIFKINAKTKDTLQLLKKKDVPINVNAFSETQNYLWAATTSGVYKISPNNQYVKYKIPIENEFHTTVVGASENHGVFVGTYLNKVFKYNATTDAFEIFKGFPKYPLLENLYVHNLFFDSNDRLWIGSYGHGVFLVDFNKETILNFKHDKQNPNSIPYDCIIAIYEDKTNNIWISTDGGGICLYDAKLQKFNLLNNERVPNDINLSLVKSLDVDHTGSLWMGTHNYGIVHLDSTKTKLKVYNNQNSGLNSNKIAYLKFIGKDLWIANEIPEIQILKPDGSIDTFNSTSEPRLDVGYIYDIFEDSKNRVWLSTSDSGLIQFDAEIGIVKQYRYHSEKFNSITSDLIYSIAEDSENGIWIGTKYKGLCRIDPETDKIQRYPEFEGLARYLYIDSKDAVWIATNTSGLIKFNPNTREKIVYDNSYGIAGSTICAILPDGDNFWLSSNRGITKFNTKNLEVENYDQFDGLQSPYFASRSGVKDSKRNLFYFGGTKGLNWFDPKDIQQNMSLPKTVITKVEVNEKLKSVFNSERFKHNENTVNFTFNSLHFSSPNRNNFKYKLVNYDNDWTESKNINFVRYTNLPPNEYAFQVISSNYDDVWNETPATYSFKINKPWYATNLAYVIYGLLIITALYLFYKYLQWRLQIKNELEFEHKEATRLKQLDEFKNRLFTNISHEFRTPLTLISGPIDNQISKPNISSEDKEELSLVKRNAKRLLNLVNQILDLSKLESGHLKLSVNEDDLDVFLKQLAHLFDFKAKQKGLDFQYEINSSDKAWFDRDALEKIVTNLLSNALKYTPKDGRIRFNAQSNDGQLIITVLNSGSTLNQDELQKLFERYYQADKHSDGAGIGLSLVKELVTLSHGSIVANTVNNDEIQFTLSLPIERSYFKASEISDRINMVTSTQIDKEMVEVDALSNQNQKNQPLLLIVEDDEDIRLYLKSILKQHYRLIEATNGEFGINKALQDIPDLIISDVMMPVKDGIELCNVLKQDDKTSHIPIILLTAKSDKAHEIEGLKIGADAYITKPFDKEKLLIQAENLIGMRLKLQKRYGQNFKLKDLAVTTIEQEFLNKLKTLLDAHITDNTFTVEALSEHLAMSRMQLHRKIKAMTGLSASEFINSERLKLAVNLLESTDRSIAEIAYETGFNSPSYFSKCFKKVYGSAPGNYFTQA